LDVLINLIYWIVVLIIERANKFNIWMVVLVIGCINKFNILNGCSIYWILTLKANGLYINNDICKSWESSSGSLTNHRGGDMIE